ncbi:MAG: SDR family NAD(P)-dependent oxidoreductase [Candidatus Lokiarchaeota archaeon]|nr:SDR family NAD(P)-dependent oxidoreductase [Candidatus Lokiarchaeota archaeon]
MTDKEWVLITGASTGIGRATAEFLASNGFMIYAGARKKRDLDALNKIDGIVSIRLDVQKSDQISEAVDFIKKRKTGLYGLINNAGVAYAGALMDMPIEFMEKQFDINLFGVHRITKAFFPLIYETKGRIIMISSDSGFFATPFFGPYCSSKFALEGYSDSLRRELLLHGVKVIIIEPGRIKTPIWDKGKKLFEKFSESIFSERAKKIGEYAIEKGKTKGLPPIEVAKVIHRALTKKKPKLRYLIASNKFEYKIIKILPEPWLDKKIKKKLKKI